MAFQLILGFRLEPQIGVARMIGIYILTGIGGVLFSCLVSPNTLGVGASTAIFGLVAAMIAWIALNWSATVNNPNRNCTMICLVVITFFNLILGFASDNVDVWGHFGGFLTGLMIGTGLSTSADPVPAKSESYWRYAGLAVTLVWLCLGITLFYTVVEPKA
jgi:rhomboid protease GluP